MAEQLSDEQQGFTIIELLVGLVIGAFVLFMLYGFFIVLPVGFATEAKCLERGYPNFAVTWNLKRYCMNLQGTVSVRVDSLEESKHAH
jgi:prepilin-type N-terminal cleavage/methylation domain-containing protein